ncbi:MAG: ComEC/Rec2 family competence protein [Eubacterium sp.]
MHPDRTGALPVQTAGVLWAMLLAEKSGLDDTVKELYTKGGIGHILAISGLHISLIGAGLFFFFRKYIMPMRAAAVLVIFLLLLYGQLTGFSISTARAVTMMILMLTARILGERYDTLNALACCGTAGNFSAITEAFVPGIPFFISYGTILGIIS